MNKLEVGMFCRIKTLSGIGRIAKLEKIDDICITDNGAVDKDNIIKASHNIIDLIEVGDYVNGCRVDYINVDTSYISCNEDEYADYNISFSNIETIVTKEQFKSMEYKVDGKNG